MSERAGRGDSGTEKGSMGFTGSEKNFPKTSLKNFNSLNNLAAF